MYIASLVVAVLLSLLAVVSGVAKLRRTPHVVKVINEVVRVPMKWLSWLAASEFAGAAGLLLGIAAAPVGLAAAAGVVLYFHGLSRHQRRSKNQKLITFHEDLL